MKRSITLTELSFIPAEMRLQKHHLRQSYDDLIGTTVAKSRKLLAVSGRNMSEI